jgi:hypothetical protein
MAKFINNLRWVPLRHRPILGQIEGLTHGVTANFAKQIVVEAEPAIRRVIRDERNRLSEALLGGLPFAAFAALTYVGTRYLIPDEASLAKAAGYGTAALGVAAGGWWSFSKLTERSEKAPESSPKGPLVLDPMIQRTAQVLVQEAEPKLRAIINDERRRFADAAMAGLPFIIGSIATFLSTMFFVKEENRALKALGYSGSTLLFGAGVWSALSGIKEAAS